MNIYNSAMFCKKVQKRYTKGKKGYPNVKCKKIMFFVQNFDFFAKFEILPFFTLSDKGQKVPYFFYVVHKYNVNRWNRKQVMRT